MMAHERFAVACCFTLLCSVTAEAAAKGPARAGIRARNEFRQGQRQAELGHFEEAIAAFERAYELKPLPAILFNIGQCHKYLGRYERAIYFFETYLRTEPSAPVRKTVEAELEEARRLLANGGGDPATAAAAATTGEEPKPTLIAAPDVYPEPGGDGAPGAETPSNPVLRQDPLQAPQPAEVTDHRAWWRHWWLWTAVAGVAVVASGAAIIVATRSPEKIPPAGTLGTVDISQ